MSLIEKTFKNTKSQNRAALVTYVMACDPDYETSLEIIKNLPQAGADIIELGMPFSDPMADGPTIQQAGTRALSQDCNLNKILDMVKEFRTDNNDTPIILMGYYNPIYHYSVDKFVKDVTDAGVDGIIIVDLPPEEEAEFTDVATPAGLSLIKLTTPTTDKQRAEKILKNSSGFIYHVSVAGITGQKSPDTKAVKDRIDSLRELTGLPIAVGFGIKTPEQAKEISSLADGIVVGSAIVKLIEKNLGNKKTIIESINVFVQEIFAACYSGS